MCNAVFVFYQKEVSVFGDFNEIRNLRDAHENM